MKREQVYPRGCSWDLEVYTMVADYRVECSDKGIQVTLKDILEAAHIDRADYSKLLNGRKPKIKKERGNMRTVPEASRCLRLQKASLDLTKASTNKNQHYPY